MSAEDQESQDRWAGVAVIAFIAAIIGLFVSIWVAFIMRDRLEANDQYLNQIGRMESVQHNMLVYSGLIEANSKQISASADSIEQLQKEMDISQRYLRDKVDQLLKR